MQVHVTVVGMCLFVRDPSARAVHVLLPRTGFSSGGGTVPDHRPKVSYPGMASTLPGIHSYAVDLRGLRSSGGSLPASIWERMLDVEWEAGVNGKVNSNRWSGNPDRSVAARVTLPWPDTVQKGSLYWWKVPLRGGGVRREQLTHQLTWQFEADRFADFEWKRTLLGPNPHDDPIGTPVPDTDGIVRIFVTNLPVVDHPFCEGMFAEHAQAYYAVLPATARNPQLDEPSPHKECRRVTPFFRPMEDSGTAFNCMLGKGSGS